MKEAAEAKKPFVSVVIPVYNEEGSVLELHAELVASLSTLGKSSEIIFVDDGSTDGTLEILKKLPTIGIISFARNYGKSKALEAGFQETHGTVIVTLDGDLQDDPKEIQKFLAELEKGSDLVTGWKVERKDPFEKRFFSKIANGTARLLAGSKVHDMNCGFKAMRSDVAKELALYGDMHRYIPALVSNMGYIVSEIPVNHRARRYGESKYGAKRLAAGFFDLLTLLFLRRFFDRPMHFFGLFGITLGGLGFLTLLYLTWVKLALGLSIGNRPLFFLGILLVVVGLQMVSLGLLGELVIRQKKADDVPLRFHRFVA